MAGKTIKRGSRDRDEERSVSAREFASKLRRVADAVEAGKSFVVQVKGERIRVPADALLSIEHEREKGIEELELQLRWSRE
ncbi:MAG TPA: amphi-Trp domain-containing protein [Methylomirabilota bacterium]|nr:amphi-Trp domain-containing protein [Methylomirabilota bacterium]